MAGMVAACLRAGDVLALTGELGAGKTCFVQGAAAALGVTQRVTSPSFVLRREYQGRLPLLHFDVYRLDTLQEVVELGYEQASDGTHVTFIEWGDAVSPLLPPEHLEIEFRLPDLSESALSDPADDGSEQRHIVLRAHGSDWRRRIVGLSADLQQWRHDA
ncbi:MAG: tRNA (adenosine(37)-N6)-threonylcarbamoyltransferase complex ATPase subunit type 1 TsaE [Actinomycetota bacterium]|nr:tRNA (adenosine(37)-N6)-threonylcarbamoyltransferase complex ATPase subunit type 1 TsaE [Actinomycetota bacterium]